MSTTRLLELLIAAADELESTPDQSVNSEIVAEDTLATAFTEKDRKLLRIKVSKMVSNLALKIFDCDEKKLTELKAVLINKISETKLDDLKNNKKHLFLTFIDQYSIETIRKQTIAEINEFQLRALQKKEVEPLEVIHRVCKRNFSYFLKNNDCNNLMEAQEIFLKRTKDRSFKEINNLFENTTHDEEFILEQCKLAIESFRPKKNYFSDNAEPQIEVDSVPRGFRNAIIKILNSRTTGKEINDLEKLEAVKNKFREQIRNYDKLKSEILKRYFSDVQYDGSKLIEVALTAIDEYIPSNLRYPLEHLQKSSQIQESNNEFFSKGAKRQKRSLHPTNLFANNQVPNSDNNPEAIFHLKNSSGK